MKKCITWNLEWASKDSKRGKILAHTIKELDPDVVCYTEVLIGIIPAGYVIEANSDYGYSHSGDRRKVLLWSKEPWSDIEIVGSKDMPTGRFISGVSGGIRYVGVCIPWRDAHVRTGRRDRTSWQDHLSYCMALSDVLKSYREEGHPICVLGDFNQRIPRVSQPLNISQALNEAVPSDYSIATYGVTDSEGGHLIDHFVVSSTLSASILSILPKVAGDGTRLSDHVGILASIEKN
jgi:exonuclease III